MLYKLFNGLSGIYTVDLTLSNVTVIKGFNINIVSEARLLESGI